MKIIEHILDELAKLVNRLISDWKILRQQKLMGNIKVALEETWVSGEGTDISLAFSFCMEEK